MTRHTVARSAPAFVFTLLLSAAAQAQLFRAYLAPDGLDANPCSLAAPCRLLPAALAAVADGGEIWMLDSANYNAGPVNIAKSVTILAVPGAVGSVVATGGNAINIATPLVKVVLRNLVIVPLPGGGGANGIVMTTSGRLTVENCLIANLPQSAITVSAAAIVRVTDTTIRDNGLFGLWLLNGAHGTVTRASITGNVDTGVYVHGNADATTTTADIADSTLAASSFGLTVSSNHAGAVVKVSIRDSRVARNSTFGLAAQSNQGALVSLAASNNIVSNNFTAMAAFFAGTKLWASGNTVSDNGTGLFNNGGLFESAGNNAVRNNTTGDTGGTITPIATL
jgi:hypothetical protein